MSFDPEVVWENIEKQLDAWEEKLNGDRLGHYNRALENWERNYGRSEGQSPNYNAPPPPAQPEVMHLTLVREGSERGVHVTYGPDVLGEPYVPPDPGHPPNTIRFGSLIPDLSNQPEFSVYVDNGSTVAIGTTYTSGDNRDFILVEYEDGKRHWVQIV